jgi:SPP1 gp7 family putative phage head morphogenesis protein
LTANRDLFDESVRHQVAVRRFAAGLAAALLALLETADRKLSSFLREKLAALAGVDIRSPRWKDLFVSLGKIRKDVIVQVQNQLLEDLRGLSGVEVAAEVALLIKTIPFDVKVAAANLKEAWSATVAKPFAGGFFKDWFHSIAEQDQRALRSAIQMGIAQGEPIPDIMRRIAGSKANLFRDGTLAATRRKVETVVRTAVNHVSNVAREVVWEENTDIISALRWTSVLDGRTTPICRSRDGKLAPIGNRPIPEWGDPLEPPTARPPALPNCRSVMTAVVDGEGALGPRPFVRDTRTPRAREVDFRAEARRTGRPIQEIRSEWADVNIGQAPGKMTYGDWLRGQPEKFQNEVLGKRRADLFRSGSVTIEQFTDPTGKTLTLKQLEDLLP